MNIIDRIAGAFGYQAKTAEVENPPEWLRASAAQEKFDQTYDGAMWKSQSELYMRLSWVQLAVKTVGHSAATTALDVLKMIPGEKSEHIDNHPFEMLLRKPNPLQSRFEFLESTFSYRALTGNSYWWLNRTSPDAEPSEMWIVPSYRIEPVPDENMFLSGYVYDPGNGQEIFLDLWEIAHFKMFHPLSMFVGLSPIEALAVVAVGDLNMQKVQTDNFGKNRGKPPGILAFADSFTPSDWKNMQKQVDEQGKMRHYMMLQNTQAGGVTWMQNAMTNEDMQFLEGREANKQEILDLYAPGLFAMLSDNATEANSNVAKETYNGIALWPALSAVAEKITNDVLPAYGDNLVAEFEDVRVTDRVLELQEQQEFGLTHTINEIRKEKYGDDGLEDERGDLLPAQIGAAFGNLMAEAPEEPEQPELVGELFGADAEVIDDEIDAELKAWQRYEINHMGKMHRPFECKHISEIEQNYIRDCLKTAKTKPRIVTAFESAFLATLKKATLAPTTPDQLLQGLHDAVMVMRESEVE